jgi:FkbM family methyltransferase
MQKMNPLLNRLVRVYLRRFPVTEGKSLLLRTTKAWIRPRDAIQVSPTKYAFSLRLNLDNPEHERIYFYGEHDERYEIALLRKLLAPGMVCWDIGANIGFFTCLFSSMVRPGGKVISFEPMPATREMLLENLTVNHIQNVEVLSVAVGSDDTRARIYFRDLHMGEGTASLYPTNNGGNSEEISIVRIDTIAPGLPSPDFVKIDVEGAQEDVWRGGAQFFSTQVPLIMAELRESTDIAKLSALQERIRGHGYRFFEILKGGRVREIADFLQSRKRNFMLAKPDTEAMRKLKELVA